MYKEDSIISHLYWKFPRPHLFDQEYTKETDYGKTCPIVNASRIRRIVISATLPSFVDDQLAETTK